MMEAYEEKIRGLAEAPIAAEGMELILAECLKMKTRWTVRLYIDKPGGVTIDDCSVISHLVGDILDVHDVPPGAYTLEVSSPGLNRPLARDRDFLKYRGRGIRVKTREKIEGSRNFCGILTDYLEVDGRKVLLLEVGGTSRTIPREAVLHAHLEYEFTE
jgi:ribosome maturation factor RimP